MFDMSWNLQYITIFQSLDRVEGDASSNNLATLNTYPTLQQDEEEEYPEYNIDDYESEAGNIDIFLHCVWGHSNITIELSQQQNSKNYDLYFVISLDSDDGEETICFYSESGDDDITCLPEVENHGKFGSNYWLILQKTNMNSDFIGI